KAVQQCRLALHAFATSVCQLYLVLLHLRHASQHAMVAVELAKVTFQLANAAWNNIDNVHVQLLFRNLSKLVVRCLEGVLLFGESLGQFLAFLSTLSVAVRHILQAALDLIVSTVRRAQKMLLSEEDLNEWESEQKKRRKELQEQTGLLEEYINLRKK
ncbi:hypothetical protein M9458_040894, partial [Cirrhinus mrigala]